MSLSEAQRIKTLIYLQNKTLCTITLAPSLQVPQESDVSALAHMPLLVHHNQYPCLYYDRIFNYFKSVLPPGTRAGNICLSVSGMQIPNDRPIGLYLRHNAKVEINVVDHQCEEPFKVVFNNWKQSLSVINTEKGAYKLSRTISTDQQREFFKHYQEGQYHGIPNQRNMIPLRGFYQGEIVQRQARLKGHVKDLVVLLWPALFDQEGRLKEEFDGKVRFTTHNIPLNLDMPTEVFFDNFDYNDGFWYISLHFK